MPPKDIPVSLKITCVSTPLSTVTFSRLLSSCQAAKNTGSGGYSSLESQRNLDAALTLQRYANMQYLWDSAGHIFGISYANTLGVSSIFKGSSRIVLNI